MFAMPLCILGCASAKPKSDTDETLKLPPLHKDVASGSKQKPAKAKVKDADPNTAPFVSGKHIKVFHKRGCPYAAKLDSPVGFNSISDALTSGRIPCVFCDPNGTGPKEP